MSADAALHLVRMGLCRYPGTGPQVARVAGPSETKHAAGRAAEVAPTRKLLTRSPQWPIDRFACVQRVWEGETVVCIGGGPSVTAERVAVIEAAHREGRCKVIAINNSYLIAPYADLLYFADARWWKWHTEGVRTFGLPADEVAKRFSAFGGLKCTVFVTGMMVADPEVFMLKISPRGEGLSSQPDEIVTGSNSGYQAVNIAALSGAKRILLLGYDMHFPGGTSHWHGGHPSKHPEAMYAKYARNFAGMLPDLQGIEVVNCSPGSAIKAFPFGDIAQCLT